MRKPLKSAWDFGELFPSEPQRQVFTVSELTTSVKKVLEGQIGQVWVTGEITNCRLQSSGHAYFSIKDTSAQLSCVLFRAELPRFDRRELQDGQKVNLHGSLTVYEARGQYQLRVTMVEVQGVGALQIAFEKLKRKLQAEGWFAAERKRPLPQYPRRVGIVTSPTGAALRDVLHVIQRRAPSIELILAPCRVQGQEAAAEIAESIRALNQWANSNPVGLILVTRGGGSLEDLWAFNEEIVARAIFESKIPVVSAVGHEIDFTISDFVADLRAATPSAAAEIITEGTFSARELLSSLLKQLNERFALRIEFEKERLSQLKRRIVRCHPRRRIEVCSQQLDDLSHRLVRTAKQKHRVQSTLLQASLARLWRLKPAVLLSRRRERLELFTQRLSTKVRELLRGFEARCRHNEARLRLLSPLHVLERGYSITLDADSGNILRSAHEAPPGSRIRTKLRDGEIQSVAIADSNNPQLP